MYCPTFAAQLWIRIRIKSQFGRQEKKNEKWPTDRTAERDAWNYWLVMPVFVGCAFGRYAADLIWNWGAVDGGDQMKHPVRQLALLRQFDLLKKTPRKTFTNTGSTQSKMLNGQFEYTIWLCSRAWNLPRLRQANTSTMKWKIPIPLIHRSIAIGM